MHKIRIPPLKSPDLAYETGFHIGDGSMQVCKLKHDYRVTFWGSTKEFDYYESVLKPLFKKAI